MRRVLCLMLTLAPAAAAAEEPRALIARAVAAHGGHERLAKARADRVSLRGNYFLGASPVAFTNELTLQLPGQFKSVVTMADGPRSHTIVHVLDGDRASITLDGQPQPLSPALLAQLRQTLALDGAMRLVTLLSDPAVALTPLGEYTIEGRPVTGVGVRRAGQADLKLFFDTRTALLMASEHQLEASLLKPVVQQARYSRHRDLGGYVRPGQVTVYRDGKKVMEAELTDARRAERIDPAEFRTP